MQICHTVTVHCNLVLAEKLAMLHSWESYCRSGIALAMWTFTVSEMVTACDWDISVQIITKIILMPSVVVVPSGKKKQKNQK